LHKEQRLLNRKDAKNAKRKSGIFAPFAPLRFQCGFGWSELGSYRSIFLVPHVFYPSNRGGMGMLLCIGAPLVIAGVIWGGINLIFMLLAKEATGRIVDERSFRTDESGTMYRPVVEFQSADGKMIQFTESMASTPDFGNIAGMGKLLASLLRGKGLEDAAEDAITVRVVYDPKKPTRAHIKSFEYLFLFPTILIVAGIIVTQFDNPQLWGLVQDPLNQIINWLSK
jgi:hypothetical protein